MRIPIHKMNGRSCKTKGRKTAIVVAYAEVDETDAYINQHYWTLQSNGYATSCIKGKNILMHRLILGITDRTTDVSHGDSNKLNCKRDNIQATTRSENMLNECDALRNTNTSGFRGVTNEGMRKLKRPWRGKITVNGKYYQTKRFESAVDAALALKELRKNLE